MFELPTTFTALAQPAGIGLVIILVMALLKRVNGKVGQIANEYGMFVSFGIAVVLAIVVALVYHFGFEAEADQVWQLIVMAWGISQTLYNAQKGVSKVVK